MSTFWLISSVIAIARRNSNPITKPSTPAVYKSHNHNKPSVDEQSETYNNYEPSDESDTLIVSKSSTNHKLKRLTDFETLTVWDEIIDNQWHIRKVRGFTIWKKTGRTLLILSGLKEDWNKDFNWSQDKINEAIKTKWFRLRL